MLYSHETMGLGHIRRNILIAKALLQAFPNANICLVSGSRTAALFPLPRGIEIITLPAVCKSSETGQYTTKNLRIDFKDLIRIRSAMILAAASNFRPDIFITDNVPWGVAVELTNTLEWLKNNAHTKCVLGLRDVLDEPKAVIREWDHHKNLHAIQKYYDTVWVYGDQNLFDIGKEYKLDDKITKKIRYAGYLKREVGLGNKGGETHNDTTEFARLGIREPKVVLCTLGGGQDGEQLANSFVSAKWPKSVCGLLVTGPFMSESSVAKIHHLVQKRQNIKIIDFHPELINLIRSADKVISMGGYNTVCEILSFAGDALLVPRITPRKEQILRARMLKQLGLIDYVHPNELTPEIISRWIAQPVVNRRNMLSKIDFQGLQRIPELVIEILSNPGS